MTSADQDRPSLTNTRPYWAVLLILMSSLALAGLQGCGGTGPQPPTITPTPTNTPTPTIIVNERLGYSLEVPRGWTTFDLQSGQLVKVVGHVDPGRAEQLKGVLADLGGEYAGNLALKLDISADPPIAALAVVGAAPLSDDMQSEVVMELLPGLLSAFDTIPVDVRTLASGETNDLPFIWGVVTADLSNHGLFNAHVFIRALRANDTAYILVLAVPVGQAGKWQREFYQIRRSFGPLMEGPTPSPTLPTPTPPPTSPPTPTVTIPGGWIRGSHRALGYSLAFPPSWGIIGVKSGKLYGSPNLAEREIILRFVRGPLLKSVRNLFGENAGHVAVDIRWRQPCRFLFCPPVTPYVGGLIGVGAVPLSDEIPSTLVIDWLGQSIDSNGLLPAKVLNLEAGKTNNLPSIQGCCQSRSSQVRPLQCPCRRHGVAGERHCLYSVGGCAGQPGREQAAADRSDYRNFPTPMTGRARLNSPRGELVGRRGQPEP